MCRPFQSNIVDHTPVAWPSTYTTQNYYTTPKTPAALSRSSAPISHSDFIDVAEILGSIPPISFANDVNDSDQIFKGTDLSYQCEGVKSQDDLIGEVTDFTNVLNDAFQWETDFDSVEGNVAPDSDSLGYNDKELAILRDFLEEEEEDLNEKFLNVNDVSPVKVEVALQPATSEVNLMDPIWRPLTDFTPDVPCDAPSTQVTDKVELTKIEPVSKAPSKKDLKKRRLCKFTDCPKRARSLGFCIAHGGGKRCAFPDCTRSSQGHGFCIAHGGGKRCKVLGCTKASQTRDLCKAHGGGPRCKIDGCDRSSQGNGLCRGHGGGKRCKANGCNKGTQRGDFCAIHGGSRPCSVAGCMRNDRGGGLCASHGGGKRCKHGGCSKAARRQGMCSAHWRENN